MNKDYIPLDRNTILHVAFWQLNSQQLESLNIVWVSDE